MTVLGKSRCGSVCAVNEYEPDEDGCSIQVPWDQQSVEREAWWLAIVVFVAWFVFAGVLMWVISRAQKCMLRMAEKKKSSKQKNKKRVIESRSEALGKSKSKGKKAKNKIAKKAKQAKEPSEETVSE